MADTKIQILNKIAGLAGLAGVRVLEYREKDVVVGINEEDVLKYDHAVFFEWANKRLDYSLFRPIQNGLVLVDYDKNKAGPEAILVTSSGDLSMVEFNAAQNLPIKIIDETLDRAKKISAICKPNIKEQIDAIMAAPNPIGNLVIFLDSLTWTDFKFADYVTPEAFNKYSYGLKAPVDQLKGEIFGPFHKVNLNGHPEIDIPWSNFILRAEWGTFLQSNNFKVDSENIDGKMIKWKYSLSGILIFELIMSEEYFEYRYYSPSGRLINSCKLKRSDVPIVQVKEPADPEKEPYIYSIWGKRLEVWAIFPSDTSENNRKEILDNFLNTLIGSYVPKNMMMLFLEGVGKERPLRVVISTKEKLRELKLIPNNTLAGLSGGRYFSKDNIAWINIQEVYSGKAIRALNVIHEIIGHALDDYMDSDNNEEYFSGQNIDLFAIRKFLTKKISEILSAEELSDYQLLFSLEKDSSRKKISQAEINRLNNYRLRLNHIVPDLYSIEGAPAGFRDRMSSMEFWATYSEIFYTKWSSYLDSCDTARFPFLKLLAINHLFYEFGVAKIGDIERKEVFSTKTFKKVLGIEFEDEKLGTYLGQFSLNIRPAKESMQRMMTGHAFNVTLGTRLDKDSPTLLFGVEFENGIDLTKYLAPDFVVYDNLTWTYSVFSYGMALSPNNGLRDVLSYEQRFYDSESIISHGVGVDVGGLMPDEVMGNDNPWLFGAHYSLRVSIPKTPIELAAKIGVNFWSEFSCHLDFEALVPIF